MTYPCWAKIYKVHCEGHEETYVGSTKEEYLSTRMSGHRCDYKKYKNGDTSDGWCKSYDIFDKYGVDNCKIALITEFLSNSKVETRKIERYWYDKLENVVNKNRPYITKEELKQDKHNRRHAKGKITCECGGYYTTTRKTEHDLTKLHKSWLEGNPLVKGILCVCGGRFTDKNKTSHEKSARHMKYLA